MSVTERVPVPKTLVAIGLGSNVGDRLSHLRFAVALLDELLMDLRQSRVYETEPVHLVEQPLFLNACVTGIVDSSPLALLERLQEIERAGGRERRERRFGPRTLDLDILLFGDLVVDTPRLTIPHPRLHDRAFALVPLAEVAPNWQHSLLNRSIARLADEVDRDGIRLTDLRLARSTRDAGAEERGEGC